MKHLDLKLLRDLRALKSQALAVALVMACGLAMMIMTRSLIRSLDTAREDYYARHRFADVFASLKRAPLGVAEQLAALPGVKAVEPGITRLVTLDLPGRAEPAQGLVQSIPDRREPALNRLFLRAGRLPSADGRMEALVSEAFAEANKLRPGDTVAALLNGRRVELRLTGVALSPEYVFEAPPGAALPDNRSYGVFWMRETELAEAYSLKGAFNTVSLALAPGARPREVIADVDRLLQTWGGLGAYGRADHPSDTRVNDEINVLRGLSFGFPLVFLSVAAFMTHAVLSRQVALQREQIAILKAFGFGDAEVARHFIKFALVIVVAGTLLGATGGYLLGQKLVAMYHLFFRFPVLEFLPAWSTLLAALAASALAALAGAHGAVRRVARLAPAEAMRPEPPDDFRPAWAERAGLGRVVSVSLRMALRNLERRPWRAVLTASALALATGILVVPSAFRDGIAHVLDHQWDAVQRQTATVAFTEAAGPGALADAARLPGVVRAEAFRSVPVELSAGGRTRRLGVMGLSEGGTLQRVLDARDQRIVLPAQGLVISRVLAEALGVGPGDEVRLRVLEGRRVERVERVAGFAEDFAGIAAYMRLDALNRLLGEGDRVSGAQVLVAAGAWPDFLAEVKRTPAAGRVVIKEAMRRSFRETTAQSIGLIQTIYLVFATTVAFGIVYNSARISLSERQRELATLRVLGFSRREVAGVLVAELVLLALAALPLGLALGTGFAKAILSTVNTETVRLPLVLTPANFAFAALVVAVATAVSLWMASRRLDRLDLVAVLKARD
ncbi:MAG: ABC transporter permease [Opitutaceae bacterium]|nr:ABC transporter permease [Opitutaceae bacterium]